MKGSEDFFMSTKITREKLSKEFGEWFDWIIREAEVYDYGRYPVKGMGIWMPYGFKIRQRILEKIRTLLDNNGHEEILLPILIPYDLLAKESEHIRGFEGEVFWVTKGGKEELDVKLALRPTSETSLTYMESFWIKSYKQLPKKYYQIVSIFRYETKATRPMIRLREVTTFKEAHTIHETLEEADEQVMEAVNIYKKFFDDLGIPYLISKRPDWDKFAGALYTIAFDTILPDGKVMQIGTAHNLGQHFTKAFDLKIQKKDESLDYPYQTSYGISDRVIAALISIHGDDRGLVLIPEVSPIQVIIIPIPSQKEKLQEIYKLCNEIKEKLISSGIRTLVDFNEEKTPGEKYFYWEMKGVPLRIDVGPRELDSKVIFIKRRDNMDIIKCNLDDLVDKVRIALDMEKKYLSERAWKEFRQKIRRGGGIGEVRSLLREGGIVEVPWCGNNSCGMEIERSVEARALGTPLERMEINDKCIMCGNNAVTLLRLAKTY
jgi:prolyl-tRNA synthetase